MSDIVLSSIKRIHKALRGEIAKLNAEALELTNDPPAISAFAGHYEMATNILHGHAHGEDTVVFPALEAKLPGIVTTYNLDHRAEEKLTGEIKQTIAGIQNGDGHPALRVLYGQIAALTFHLTRHMDTEEAHFYPLMDDTLTDDEKIALFAGVYAQMPAEAFAQGMPWFAGWWTPEEMAEEVSSYKRMMPQEKVEQIMAPLAKSVSPDYWEALAKAHPELSKYS
ncbi:MAG: hypothetical protein JW395_0806 [Nitrospira sp.]|nr:hypothetical protein [Nitrospira sp.]